MATTVGIKVEIDPSKIQGKISNLIDEQTMLMIHQELSKMCEPYVPFLSGTLSGSGVANVTAQGVTYSTPYARYQYYLHDMNEDLAGVTNRTRVYHPLATSYWDKAMMMYEGDVFKERVREILIRRANGR